MGAGGCKYPIIGDFGGDSLMGMAYKSLGATSHIDVYEMDSTLLWSKTLNINTTYMRIHLIFSPSTSAMMV